MRVTLPDGTVLEGPPEEVLPVWRALKGEEATAAPPASVVQEAAPVPLTTFRELWNEWEPSRATKPDAGIVAVAGAVLGRTRFEFEGESTTLLDLAVAKISPYVIELTKAALEASKTRRGAAPRPSYIQRILTVAQSCLAWHVEISKRIDENPMRGWRRYPEEARRQWKPKPNEMERICAVGHPMFADITMVQWRCLGMRPGEVRLLQKNEVLIAQRRIRLDPTRTKNRRTAPIPIPEDIVPILESRIRESRGDFVFVAPSDPTRSKPVSKSTYESWYRKARKKAGLTGPAGERWVPYHARHAGINQAVSDGADAELVSKAARVGLKVMSRHYMGFTDDQQERLLAIQNRRSVTPMVPSPMDRRGPHSLESRPAGADDKAK